MSIDELKNEWRAAEDRAAPGVKIDAARLRPASARRIRSSLRWSSAGVASELLLNLVAVVALGELVAARGPDLRFWLPALALELAALASLIANARQLVWMGRVDFGAGVLEVQTALQRLALARIRLTLGTLLIAPLLWVPLVIVGLRALGVDAYAALGARILLANLLFGAALIPLAIFLSRRYVARMEGSPALRRILESIAGHHLARARAALEELTAQERLFE